MRFLVRVKGRKGQQVWLYRLLELGSIVVPINKWMNVLYPEREIKRKMVKHLKELQDLQRQLDEAVTYRKQLEDMVDKVPEDKLVSTSQPFYFEGDLFPIRCKTPPEPDKESFGSLERFLKKGNPMTMIDQTVKLVESLRKEGKVKVHSIPEPTVVPGESFSNEASLKRSGAENTNQSGNNSGKNNNQHGVKRPYRYNED